MRKYKFGNIQLAGRPGIRIPVGVTSFSLLQDVQAGSVAHLTFRSVDSGVLWGSSGRGVKSTAHFHVVPSLGMRGAVPLFPLHVFGFFTFLTSSNCKKTSKCFVKNNRICWILCGEDCFCYQSSIFALTQPASSHVSELFVGRLMSGRTDIFLRVKDVYPVLDIMSVFVLFLKTLTNIALLGSI
jgi:hypothetical protein